MGWGLVAEESGVSITTYSELQTAIGNWLDRSDLSARIPEFIALAEAQMNRDLRIRDMQKRVTTSMVSGTEYYDTPDDMLEIRNIQINTDPVRKLRFVTPAQQMQEYPHNSIGTPKTVSIIGDELRLRPIPDSTNTLEIQYYGRISALSDANTTNWLLTYAPDVYLFASLVQASAFVDVPEDQLAKWVAGYESAAQGVNRTSRDGNYMSELAVRLA